MNKTLCPENIEVKRLARQHRIAAIDYEGTASIVAARSIAAVS
jgi:hypothetical protein